MFSEGNFLGMGRFLVAGGRLSWAGEQPAEGVWPGSDVARTGHRLLVLPRSWCRLLRLDQQHFPKRIKGSEYLMGYLCGIWSHVHIETSDSRITLNFTFLKKASLVSKISISLSKKQSTCHFFDDLRFACAKKHQKFVVFGNHHAWKWIDEAHAAHCLSTVWELGPSRS